MVFIPRTVFVLGAGFTKALLPDSPLLIDDFDLSGLTSKFAGFAHATRVLDLERAATGGDKIDLERLMTRLDGLMPYDHEMRAEQEFGMLLDELKERLLGRLVKAKKGPKFVDELNAFACYCLRRNVTCITFNYDDILDEALYRLSQENDPGYDSYWRPDSGYGFFCKSAVRWLRDTRPFYPGDEMTRNSQPEFFGENSLLLLKLHGSVNWFPKRGSQTPYAADAIVHAEEWFDSGKPVAERAYSYAGRVPGVGSHIDQQPFVVPPVLAKASLMGQPILRLLWTRALVALTEAEQIVFVGYSLPETDMAVRVLFREAVASGGGRLRKVLVVDIDGPQKDGLEQRYREIFTAARFEYVGCRAWIQRSIAPVAYMAPPPFEHVIEPLG